MFRSFWVLWLVTPVLWLSACAPAPEQEDLTVQSHVYGEMTATAPDSISGLSLLFFRTGAEGQVDTLGYVTPDAEGRFTVDLTAPERGIYAMALLRNGTPIRIDDIALAQGDSIFLPIRLPLTRAPLRPRSTENIAWLAYKNARLLLDEGQNVDLEAPNALDQLRQVALQTSTILYSMRDNYAGTLAAEIAMAESILLLESIDDTLLVDRALELEPTNVLFVSVGRAVRRAASRVHGQTEALRLVHLLRERATRDEEKAALMSEVVMAHLDSLDGRAARSAAQRLVREHPNSTWVVWADRAQYEAENLMPGMRMPGFDVRTLAGARLTPDSLRGNLTILEFVQTTDPEFRRELAQRDLLFGRLRDEAFRVVTVALDADTLMARAFFSQNNSAHHELIAPRRLEDPFVQAYNIQTLPTRYLIEPDGRILGRHVGPGFFTLQRELLTDMPEAP